MNAQEYLEHWEQGEAAVRRQPKMIPDKTAMKLSRDVENEMRQAPSAAAPCSAASNYSSPVCAVCNQPDTLENLIGVCPKCRDSYQEIMHALMVGTQLKPSELGDWKRETSRMLLRIRYPETQPPNDQAYRSAPGETVKRKGNDGTTSND